VSHALARLRDLFGDDLFLRSGGALRPTARAEALAEPLDAVLGEVTGLLRRSPARFDPSRLSRAFVIGTTDGAEILLMPEIVRVVRAEAPGVDLVTRFLGDDIDRAVSTREVDLAIGTRFRPLAGVLAHPLGHQRMVLVARAGHPVARAGVTAAAYAAMHHVLVAPRDSHGGVIDVALEKLALHRRVVLRVPHFSTAAFVVSTSDLVVALPESFAWAMAASLPLAVLPLPVEVDGFDFALAWNLAARDDQAHAWLRAEVARVAERAFRAPGAKRSTPVRTRARAAGAG
jgi:DNA-binding transcriptional LysR family regulator